VGRKIDPKGVLLAKGRGVGKKEKREKSNKTTY